MNTPGEVSPPAEGERRKLTFYLMIGGVASLLIPALYLLYSKLNEVPDSRAGLDASDIFTKRGTDGSSAMKITPAASQAPPAASFMPGAFLDAAAPAKSTAPASTPSTSAPPQDSFSFIRGGNDYREKTAQQQQPAPAPAPIAAPAPPPKIPAPAPPPVQAAAPPVKKAFSAPHLSGSKFGGGGSSLGGGHSFGGGFGQTAQQGGLGGQQNQIPAGATPQQAAALQGMRPDQRAQAIQAYQARPGGVDQMLQNLPGGTKVPQNLPNIPGLGDQGGQQPQQ